MKTKERVSVIVPVYNVEKYIRRCVESIRAQTFGDLEIFLIDDGSKDSSGALCDALAKEDDRITVKHVENGGVAAARNLGLDSCSGDYITFVDADDYLEQDFVETLLGMLHRDQTFVAVCANTSLHETVKINEGVIELEREFSHGKYQFSNVVWGKLYRREILEGLRFQEDLCVGEDTLFFRQVMSRLARLSYTAGELYHYVRTPNSAMRKVFTENRYTEITAWQRLCEFYRGDPKRYTDCMADYVDRCRCMYTLMWRARVNTDPRCKTLLREVRGNYKYVWRSECATWMKKAYLAFFALTPRVFSAVYCFLLRLHVDEVVYGPWDSDTD